MTKTIIGVMGPGDGASQKDINLAHKLGKFVANQNWTLLTGGRNKGVMDAASKGAKESGGLTIGILPDSDKRNCSKFVDIPVCTGMGSARNNINILSSDVVIACGSGAGTTSEIMLALKAQKPLILLAASPKLIDFITEMNYPLPSRAQTADQAIQIAKTII